jgi:hypothetical protein
LIVGSGRRVMAYGHRAVVLVERLVLRRFVFDLCGQRSMVSRSTGSLARLYAYRERGEWLDRQM